MKNNMSPHENRREHIRVSANLYFCVSIIEGVDPDTNNFIYGDCFCTKSTNISSAVLVSLIEATLMSVLRWNYPYLRI